MAKIDKINDHGIDYTLDPDAHVSSDSTKYGKGDGTNFGHVKLSDSFNDSSTGTSGGTAATPKAVNDAMVEAEKLANATGILTVDKGGTGAGSFAADSVLVGNGTGAIQTRTITSQISSDTSSTNIPTDGAVRNAITAGTSGALTGVSNGTGNGNVVTGLSKEGSNVTWAKDITAVTTVQDAQGTSGGFVTDISQNGATVTVTKGNALTSITASDVGSGNVVTAVSASGNTVSVTKGITALTGIGDSQSGNGNVVTAVSAAGGTVSVTKGITISASLELGNHILTLNIPSS